MRKIFTAMTVVTLVGILGASDYACAQEAEDFSPQEIEMIQQMRERREGMRAKMKEELGLTDDQVQQLEDHRTAHRSRIKGYRDKMKTLRDAFKTELEKSDIDTAKVYRLHEEIKTLENEMADHRLEGILQLREILTPEQFQKFHGKAEKMGGRMGGFHGRHKGGSGGFMPDRP